MASGFQAKGFRDGRGPVQHVHHRARRENLAGLGIAQFEQVHQILVFLRLERAVFAPQRRQRQNFFAGDFVLVAFTQQLRQARRYPYQRIHQPHQPTDSKRRRHCQLSPVGRPKRLRDDLGEIQNRQGQQDRNQGLRLGAKHTQRLRADTRCTHGVGEGIENKNARKRFIQTVLYRLDGLPGLGSRLGKLF